MTTTLSTAPFDTGFFAGRAKVLDAGETDTRPAIGYLGARGLFDVDAGGDDYGASFGVIRDVASACMASGFSVWAHRMAVEYLSQWPTALTEAQVLPALRDGRRTGATAMAAALAESLGLGDLGVTARRDGDAIVLDGVVRWASNLFDDAVVVLPARTDGAGRRAAVAVPLDTPGVHPDPPPPLLALDGTASSSLRLQGARLDVGYVLTTDLGGFLAGIRRPFQLLQSAFCVGLAQAAVEEVDTAGVNAVFGPDLTAVSERLDTLAARLPELLRDPAAAYPAVLGARLEAARLATEATALEAKSRGGRGYVRTSQTARRLREAAFLPIQSPTEAQLRWELSRSAS